MVINGSAVFVADSILPDAFLLKTNRFIERDGCIVIAMDMQLDPLKYFMFLHPIDKMQKQFFTHAAPAPVFFHAHSKTSRVSHAMPAVCPAIQHADNLIADRRDKADFIRTAELSGDPETLFPMSHAKFGCLGDEVAGVAVYLPDVAVQCPGVGQFSFSDDDLVAQGLPHILLYGDLGALLGGMQVDSCGFQSGNEKDSCKNAAD